MAVKSWISEKKKSLKSGFDLTKYYVLLRNESVLFIFLLFFFFTAQRKRGKP
jgi:hypothetical protein